MSRPQIDWVLVPDAPVLTTDEELAKRYPEPQPETPEALASMRLKAEAKPPSENDISRYACALVEAGELTEAERYATLLSDIIPESRVAEVIKLYIADRRRGGDKKELLRMRVAHSKRLYRAIHEDCLRRMTPQQLESDRRFAAARAKGSDAILREARRQLEENAATINLHFNIEADKKREWNLLVAWRNRRLMRELRRLEKDSGVEGIAAKLPALVIENSDSKLLYTAGIEFYIEQNMFAEAEALTAQARARFPRIVHFELCEEALNAICAAPSVEEREAQKIQLASDLTALRWAVQGRKR